MSSLPHHSSRAGREPATLPAAADASSVAAGTSSVAAAAPPPPAPAGGRAPQRRSWQGVRALLIRLHFSAGVFVAPFLVVTALTGLLYAFAPQLDLLVHGDQLRVERVGSTPQPLSEQVAAARAAHPEGTLASVVTPAAPEETTRVVLSVPGLGEKQRTVFVDPYTGEVTGALTTSSGSTPVTTWLSDLHGNLHLGEAGGLYSEMAASWLWVLAGVGLVLWAARGRRKGAKGAKGFRRLLLGDRNARGVRRTRSRHAVTGVWLAVGLLFLSATGLTWSAHAGARFDALMERVSAPAPALDTSLRSAAGGPGDAHRAGDTPGHGGHDASGSARQDTGSVAGIDPVLDAAREAGLAGPVELTPPAGAHHAWSVAQDDTVWPVRLDEVAVDPATGEVTDRARFADQPVPARLSTLGIQAHMGRLFGLANQVLLAAIAVGLLLVIAWGYRMWWQRRPTRADRGAAPGPAPRRGAWRRLPLPVLALGVPAVAFVGWALPVLGVSLLLFLAVDVAAGLHRRRRRARDRMAADG
ncbi:PepSY domain-containing protein [Streptomyces sp. JJ36]|uniref:PepSY-associated TM helix domain-containing protein n=1 Tax=Streptomyces sp. JJ36 TaxID=2736645 RepID=UPI001F2BE892|nr:PepSY domain-containing protein [Streptomyces sp. JJ36]MCF6524546.1 PepSY domain-containing protein [Streptomyces sp. JJ36]